MRHLLKADHPGESLLFLCVVVNDCETLMRSLETLEDDNIDVLEKMLSVEEDEATTDGSAGVMGAEDTEGGAEANGSVLEELEENLGNAIGRCGRAGSLALMQMQRVIFDDLDVLEQQLFFDEQNVHNGINNNTTTTNTTSTTSTSSNGNTLERSNSGVEGEKSTEEALDTMLYTLEDYFIDFQSRIHPRPFLRLMGMCYDQMICL